MGELVDALSRRGQRVSIAPTSCSPEKRRLSRVFDQWVFVAGLFAHLRQNPAVTTVVTLDAPAGMRLLLNIWRRFGRQHRHIAWVMDLYWLQSTPRSLAEKLRRKIEILGLRHVDEAVVLGECMRDLLTRWAPRVPSTVIPIWQPDTWTRAGNPVNADEDEMPDTELIYSGHAGVAHSLVTLARAIEANNDLRFRVIGWGVEVDRVAQTVEVEHLARTTVHPPALMSKAIDNLNNADVHVASLRESMTGTCVPSKAYAAMALGKPLLFLGDERCQVARDIRRANCGFVVSTDDESGIRRALARLANSDLRAVLGSNARAYYAASLTLDRGADRWQALLRTDE